MPASTGRTASLPYTRPNEECPVASLVVVRAGHSTLVRSSTHAPLASSKDFFDYVEDDLVGRFDLSTGLRP